LAGWLAGWFQSVVVVVAALLLLRLTKGGMAGLVFWMLCEGFSVFFIFVFAGSALVVFLP
jgi:hypothetical protein